MGRYKTIYRNKSFSREKIELDGKSFFNCTFEGCIIILERGEAQLEGCEIINCRLVLRGEAYTVAKIIKLFTGKSPLKVLDLEEPLFEKREKPPGAVRGKVEAVCLGKEKGTPKQEQHSIELEVGVGVTGDAHARTEKEVSLLAREDVDELARETGIKAPPGSFAENISTRGISLVDMKPGERLTVGEAEIEIVAIGKDPSCSHTYSYEGHSLLPTRGVFARVVRGGRVKTGDPVVIGEP